MMRYFLIKELLALTERDREMVSIDGGAGLQTFAYWYIRKAMQSDDSLYSDNIIRVPQSARDQLKQINQVIQQHEGPLTTRGNCRTNSAQGQTSGDAAANSPTHPP